MFAFMARKVSHCLNELIAVHLRYANVAYDEIESLHLHLL